MCAKGINHMPERHQSHALNQWGEPSPVSFQRTKRLILLGELSSSLSARHPQRTARWIKLHRCWRRASNHYLHPARKLETVSSKVLAAYDST